MRKEASPFVKWAGGKNQLLPQFEKFFPREIKRYFDPFVGGGAVAFHVINNFKPSKVCFSDINEDLINCYKVIKKDVDKLIKELNLLKVNHNKENYYKVRGNEETNPTKRAARFIYLNKTCFNGLYRVNLSGKFNVPIGSYNNPSIFSEERLKAVSKVLQNVTIETRQFNEMANHAKKGDFVYLDPPYYPLKKSSFTTYTKDKFLDEEQKQLFEVFKRLDKRGCLVMHSNSNTGFIKELYKKYNIQPVNARRSINSNANGRGKIKEVVIMNY